MDIQNRTVGSFFQGQNVDVNSLDFYGACFMYVTWLKMSYPDINVINTLPEDVFTNYAQVTLKALPYLVQHWGQYYSQISGTAAQTGNVASQRRTA